MNDPHAQELFPASAQNRDKPPGKIGGCVGTFLQLFDWNPRKRLFSTKRLPAERPNLRKAPSTKKKFKDERMPVAKLLLLAEEENRGGFPSPKKIFSVPSIDRGNAGIPGKKVPGVVARLMGLESLPEERAGDGRLSPQHPKLLPQVDVRPLQELLHTRQEPALLSDLLRERDYLEAKKLALTDRLHVAVPGLVKKFPDPVPQNYVSPRDGFKKPLRSDSHLQPHADNKFKRSLRPVKRSPRDLTAPKNLILALSPHASGDGMRPILLPSKVHNKLMNSPVKSPTKMGSRSARLLEAAVKILEPSMQSSNTRARVPPVRSSSGRESKDVEREPGTEERREKAASIMERKVALSSSAARALKGQSMIRSWNGNGREEAGRNNSSFQDSPAAKKRNDQSQLMQSRSASPLRATNRSRNISKGFGSQEGTILKVTEEIKSIVPQGFEETYGGGLKPLNVGRRDDARLDKCDMEDSSVKEKHIISSVSSLSSLSVTNSPYSECSEGSTTSSIQDPLRRSGSVKDSAPPPPAVSKSRFMRSKSVKEEKCSTSANGVGAQGPQYSKSSAKEIRVKQEIPQQAHHSHQQSHNQVKPESSASAASLSTRESPRSEVIDSGTVERYIFQEVESIRTIKDYAVDGGTPARECTSPQSLPKVFPEEADMCGDESLSSRSFHTSSTCPVSAVVSGKHVEVSPRSSSVGGLLSYSRLFRSRKSVDRKGERKEKKGQADAPRKNESSLVKTLLRRKSSLHSASSQAPAPVQSMEKPKKRGAKVSISEPPSREVSDAEAPGYFSEDYSTDVGFDLSAAVQSENCAHQVEDVGECIIFPDDELSNGSPSKSVGKVFPMVPLDKGCLRLLDEMDEKGCLGPLIEGFDCVEQDDSHDNHRDGLFSYSSGTVDDLKLKEMFLTGRVTQGSGRNGFSFTPLVDLEAPPWSSLESFRSEGAAEIEKWPEMPFTRCQMLAQEGEGQDSVLGCLGREDEGSNAAIEDAKARLLNELEEARKMVDDALDQATERVAKKFASKGRLEEARKMVDDALDEATERVAKKFASKGRVVLAAVDGDEAVCSSVGGNDDCGQPSPVSVLECPFEEDESRSSQGNLHESTCETEEDFDEDDDGSLIDDLLLQSATTRGPRKGTKITRNTVITDNEVDSKIQSEKIMDAILDISRMHCIDPSSCGLIVENESFEEEEEYVRKILYVWEVFPEASGHASSADLPIASSLFDRLESQGRATAWQREKQEELESPKMGAVAVRSLKQWQGLWLHRRLLFDCLNETLAYSLKFKYPDPWMGIPILRQAPTGKALMHEVYTEMKDWRDVKAEELDTIIEMDMSRGFGNWSNLKQEIAEIGLDIERSLLKVMIEELVSELMESEGLPNCPSILLA